MLPKSLHLLIAALLAIASLGIALTGLAPTIWLAWVGVAMAILVPGYALSAAVLPALGRAERLVTSIGLCLVLDVAGGFVLNVTPWGLQPTSWAVWLSGITLVSGAVAWLRRGKWPVSIEPAPIRLSLGALAGFALAIVITAAAVVTAQTAVRQSDLPFTQLWTIPARVDGTCTLQIGVRNQEDRLERYELEIASADKQIETWPRLEVGSNEQWTTRFSFVDCPTTAVQVRLYRLDQPDKVYRMTLISPASFATPAVFSASRQ